MANENGEVTFQKPGILQQGLTVGSDVVGGALRGGWKGFLIGAAILVSAALLGGFGIAAVAAAYISGIGAVGTFFAGLVGTIATGLGLSAVAAPVLTGVGAGAALGGIFGPSNAADRRAATQLQVHGISPSRGATVALADGRQENLQAQREYNNAMQQLQNSNTSVIPMVGDQQMKQINARNNAGVSQSNAVA